MATGANGLTKAKLGEMRRTMVRIRRFEETAQELFEKPAEAAAR